MDKFFCPLPFIHQFVCSDGTAVCCRIPNRHQLSLQEFEESNYVAEIRQSLLNGEIPSECLICKNDEDKGYHTIRKQALVDFGNDVGRPYTFLDLRYDNLCNLACRMCNSSYSSIWAKQIDEYPELKKYQSPFRRNNVSFKILENFHLIRDNVKKIALTGGEPLLIKDHLQLLDLLIKHNRTDVEITVTTNLTALNPNWKDLITKFQTVHWTVSIDAIETIGEYIRWPNYSWETIDKNLDFLLQYKHSVAINTTLTTYSLLDIDRLVDYFISKRENVNGPFELWFSVAEHPSPLILNKVPNEFRSQIVKKINYSIEKLKKIDNHENSCKTLEGVKYVIQNDLHLPSNDFFVYTKMLDQQRNQDFFETFKGKI